MSIVALLPLDEIAKLILFEVKMMEDKQDDRLSTSDAGSARSGIVSSARPTAPVAARIALGEAIAIGQREGRWRRIRCLLRQAQLRCHPRSPHRSTGRPSQACQVRRVGFRDRRSARNLRPQHCYHRTAVLLSAHLLDGSDYVAESESSSTDVTVTQGRVSELLAERGEGLQFRLRLASPMLTEDPAPPLVNVLEQEGYSLT